MNRILCLFIFCFATYLRVYPQDFSGNITFKLQLELKGDTKDKIIAQHNRDRIASAELLKYNLRFTRKGSQYNLNEFMSMDADHRIHRRAEAFGGKGSYYQFPGKHVVQHRELMGDEYLIEYDKPLEWSISQEERHIAGYRCLKATAPYHFDNGVVKEDRIVEAWFTPEIPVPFGPKEYGGLPGLILWVRDHETTLIAIEVLFDNEPTLIKVPTKGIRMTYDELNDFIGGRGETFFQN